MFFIQDPEYSDSLLLHEALINATKKAIYGAGVYAFVTIKGVELFLEDKTFKNFIKEGEFNLIVGIDEITNEKTLISLQEKIKDYEGNLNVLAFLNNDSNSLFHPKFSWFKKDEGGILLLGSGNLTEKGLRKNREAFNYIEVNENEIQSIEEDWDSWLTFNKDKLKSLDNSQVVEKVKENKFNYKTRKKSKPKTREKDKEVEEGEEGEEGVWDFDKDNKVLISEIPRNGDRLTQANFTKKAFKDFFGVIATKVDEEQIVLFRNVINEAKLAEVESRKAVAVSSHNYRFELNAIRGKKYPETNRPIGVFIRISIRMFIYIVSFPKDSYYNEIKTLLYDKVEASGSRLRRYYLNVEELKNHCPSNPLLKLKD